MNLRIHIDPVGDELQEGCEILAAATLPPGRGGWVLAGVFAAVAVGALLLAPAALPVTLLLACGGLIVGLSVLQLEARSRLRRAFAADPHHDEPYTVEVGADGIRTYCDHVDTRITWSGITRVVETRDYFVFVRGSSGGATIPRRVLSPADHQRLRQMVREWSPDRGAELAGAVEA